MFYEVACKAASGDTSKNRTMSDNKKNKSSKNNSLVVVEASAAVSGPAVSRPVEDEDMEIIMWKH